MFSLHRLISQKLQSYLKTQSKQHNIDNYRAGDIVELHIEREKIESGKKQHGLSEKKETVLIRGMILAINGKLTDKSIKLLTKHEGNLIIRIFSIYNSKVVSIKLMESNNIDKAKLLFLEKKLFDKNFQNIKINAKLRSLIQKF